MGKRVSRRTLVNGAIVMTVTSVVCFLILELLLRIFLPIHSFTVGTGDVSTVPNAAVYGWGYAPGAEITQSDPDTKETFSSRANSGGAVSANLLYGFGRFNLQIRAALVTQYFVRLTRKTHTEGRHRAPAQLLGAQTALPAKVTASLRTGWCAGLLAVFSSLCHAAHFFLRLFTD